MYILNNIVLQKAPCGGPISDCYILIPPHATVF